MFSKFSIEIIYILFLGNKNRIKYITLWDIAFLVIIKLFMKCNNRIFKFEKKIINLA